jgi:hypothetical protein
LKAALRIAALVLCFASFALVSCNTQGSQTVSNTTTLAAASTASTRTPPGTASASIIMAVAFYQAVTVHNYNKAYSYLDTDAQTLDGTVLNRENFLQMAQTADKEEGQVSEFSASVDPTNPMCVIVDVVRGQRLHYHSHLFLRMYQQQWTIFSFDRI